MFSSFCPEENKDRVELCLNNILHINYVCFLFQPQYEGFIHCILIKRRSNFASHWGQVQLCLKSYSVMLSTGCIKFSVL